MKKAKVTYVKEELKLPDFTPFQNFKNNINEIFS